MFAFQLGKFVGIALVILGVLNVLIALSVVYGTADRESMELALRHFSGSRKTGKVIDDGIIMSLTGLAFWMVAEIGKRMPHDEKGAA